MMGFRLDILNKQLYLRWYCVEKYDEWEFGRQAAHLYSKTFGTFVYTDRWLHFASSIGHQSRLKIMISESRSCRSWTCFGGVY